MVLAAMGVCGLHSSQTANASPLRAGVAKVDITDSTGPVNDPLYVKALVLKSDTTTAVIITRGKGRGKGDSHEWHCRLRRKDLGKTAYCRA